MFFLMELVWYRMLGPILGGTAFTFGLILAVALAGIGVGGALYPLRVRSRAPQLGSLAVALAVEALALAIPLGLGDRLAILAAALRPLGAIGFGGQIFGWLIVTKIVVFPAAVVSGFQFPLLVALLCASGGTLAVCADRVSSAGLRYAAFSEATRRALEAMIPPAFPKSLLVMGSGAIASHLLFPLLTFAPIIARTVRAGVLAEREKLEPFILPQFNDRSGVFAGSGGGSFRNWVYRTPSSLNRSNSRVK